MTATGTTRLIPRDVPIPLGRKLRFRFTITYDVLVDDDLLGDDQAAPLDAIEDWLGAGHLRVDSESVWMHLSGAYERNVVEHTAELVDVEYDPALDDPRFEQTWEQRERRAGKTANWPSRRWLDELPAPKDGASGGEGS